MNDLADFLLARLGEDERDARKAGSRKWGSINRGWDSSYQRDIAALGDGPTERLFPVPYNYDEHVARWSPARVLAECEAKRRMLDRDDGHTNNWMSDLDTDPDSRVFGSFCLLDREPWPCSTVRLLALPYADHEQFKEEWR